MLSCLQTELQDAMRDERCLCEGMLEETTRSRLRANADKIWDGKSERIRFGVMRHYWQTWSLTAKFKDAIQSNTTSEVKAESIIACHGNK